MKTLQAQGQRGFSRISIWVPIVISLISLGISIGSFYDNHRQAVAQATPNVSFVEDTDTDDPLVGLKIMNDGPGVARLKHLTYYVDRKPLDNLTQVMDFANLPDEAAYFEFDNDTTLAAGEQEWLLSMRTKAKGAERKSLEQFVDFIDQKFAVEAEYCSVVTGQCETQCSRDGWCK